MAEKMNKKNPRKYFCQYISAKQLFKSSTEYATGHFYGGKAAIPQAIVVAEKKSRGWPFARDNRDFRDKRDRDDRAKRDERDGMGNCASVPVGKCVMGEGRASGAWQAATRSVGGKTLVVRWLGSTRNGAFPCHGVALARADACPQKRMV
jgi:hypothetical protein